MATAKKASKRPGGRSELVVRKVLEATLVELSRKGYAGLRVEDVAARAGVAKTTIYRRWPTTPDLVRAALRERKGTIEAPDTGSVRGDALALLRAMVTLTSTAVGRGLARVLMRELDQPDLARIVKGLRAEGDARWIAALKAGVERGELPPRTDLELVAEAMRGPVVARLFRRGERLTDGFLGRLVDLVLAGAQAKKRR
jgi:AcrR family transcriptional regulator